MNSAPPAKGMLSTRLLGNKDDDRKSSISRKSLMSNSMVSQFGDKKEIPLSDQITMGPL